MHRLISYLSALTVTEGRRAGEGLTVLPWQRRFVRGAFAPGRTTAALSVARGNGKTVLVAGIAAAAIDGPLAVPRGETIIVASSCWLIRADVSACVTRAPERGPLL